MNAKQVRAINDEYDRYAGIPRREGVATLWDHGLNQRVRCPCVVIDLGRRPDVPPAQLTREDRALMALRERKPLEVARIERTAKGRESLAMRLHEWAKSAGAFTYQQAVTALDINDSQAKNLLTSNAHLFRFWKKIAGQSYYVAI